jgi:4-hydroxy-3-polyprenylbenzoate decarboxylase
MKKILVAIPGASGTIYARRFFQHFPYDDWEVHAVVSQSARIVASYEGGLNLPPHVKEWDEKDLTAPSASGSNKFEVMVVIPCSTTTLGKLAHGIADNLITRSGEVFLKERRKLILVPRETPLSLIQIKNMELLTLAGAHVIPATPSFYGNPKTIEDVVDTVIARVYDHAGVQAEVAKRWRKEEVQEKENYSEH